MYIKFHMVLCKRYTLSCSIAPKPIVSCNCGYQLKQLVMILYNEKFLDTSLEVMYMIIQFHSPMGFYLNTLLNYVLIDQCSGRRANCALLMHTETKGIKADWFAWPQTAHRSERT